MIRTIIVDDEILTGVGIRTLIDGKEDIIVADIFSDPENALDYLRENMIDVVITDIEMGEMNGLDFISVIRKEKLAPGIIILSCHADFAYAQEAIAKGTDSYMLKHSITAEILSEEVKKVFGKHQYDRRNVPVHSTQTNKKPSEDEIFRVAVVRIPTLYENSSLDPVMLVSLLDRLVSRYDMGTLISPYNRENFILFRLNRSMNQEERYETCISDMEILKNSILQYTGKEIKFGLSNEFYDLKFTTSSFDEAQEALEGIFYHPKQSVFMPEKKGDASVQLVYSDERFLETDGLDTFKNVFRQFLFSCSLNHISVTKLRAILLQRIGSLIEYNLQIHRFSQTLTDRWKDLSAVGEIIISATTAEILQENLLSKLSNFHTECLQELDMDSLMEALEYIERNLSEKISLADLAEVSNMSIPTFSKKFKQRTGTTLVNYLNDRRVEKVKILLKNKKLSLEQIAEETGFSNANYLIRVFKKSTGKTISEYRN